MYIDPVSTSAGAAAPTDEKEPRIVATKNAKVGAQAILEDGTDIAVWEREFTPETQSAIDRYLHFLTTQPSSPLPKVESTGSALSLALEIAKALEVGTPAHLQDEMRLIARDIMGRLCDYAENSSSNGLAMRFEFRRDAMPEAMPGIVCTTYSLSALVSSQVAADKAAYFAENFASKQVRQFNPSWVGTTTANRDLGAYLALGDIPHILLVIGSVAANDMRTTDNNADLNLIRAMGPDILSIQGAIAAAGAAMATNGDAALGNDIAELMEKLAELQSLADHAGTLGALDGETARVEALLQDIGALEQSIAASMDAEDASALLKGVRDTLETIAIQFGNTPLADMVMELAVSNPAQSRLEAALAEAEAVLAEMLEAGDLSAEQEVEVQKLKDMISNHLAGEPLSSAVIAQLEVVGKLASGPLADKLTKSMQSLTSAQAAVATLAAGLGIDVLRQSASMVEKLQEMQTAIQAARTGEATLTPAQAENIRLIEPQIAATLAHLQSAPASTVTLSDLGKLETVIAQVQTSLPVTTMSAAEGVAAQASQISVSLHVKTAEIHDTSVQNVVRSVATLQSLESVQTQLAQNKLSSPQQTALNNQITQAIEALKAAPANADTLQKLNALATTIASIPPSANFLPPGAQSAMPGVIAGISALGGKQGGQEGATTPKKAEQAAKAEERKTEAKQESERRSETHAQQAPAQPVQASVTAPINQSPSAPAETPVVFMTGAAVIAATANDTVAAPTSPSSVDLKTNTMVDTAPAWAPTSPPAAPTQNEAKLPQAEPAKPAHAPAHANDGCGGGSNCECFKKAAEETVPVRPSYDVDARKEQLMDMLNDRRDGHVHSATCGCKDHFDAVSGKDDKAPEIRSIAEVVNDDDLEKRQKQDFTLPPTSPPIHQEEQKNECGDCKGERGCCNAFGKAARDIERHIAQNERMDLSSNVNDNDAYDPEKRRRARENKKALNM